MSKFNGSSGMKHQAEARRHVYKHLADMFQAPGGCLAYHLDLDSDALDEFDRRRLNKAHGCGRARAPSKGLPMTRFLLLLALVLAGCTAPAETTSSAAGGPACSQYLDAQTACVSATHYLEGYSCTFPEACNAACPSDQAICSSSIDACKAAADESLPGVSPTDLDATCQRVVSYCNSVIVCEPP